MIKQRSWQEINQIARQYVIEQTRGWVVTKANRRRAMEKVTAALWELELCKKIEKRRTT